ncbi:hypothetical protein TGAM01_v207215 [Trichoderma gamsii]|uniref:C2H2-type domain-containing protein n=1 Tax=Trichoderma gamsii TaxID=398673 RepID=A0A2P4ZHX4_9HYPO|nr:hypothetical protein TGAM01_v207215 [Trichoderma gamsii]PON23887.1 hypothetical protein TGAM01_v207215 [Trichoderma gamsii]
MAASPPPIISDLPQSTSQSPVAPQINKARGDIASTASTAAAQIASLSPPATSPASRQPSMAGSNAIGSSPPATTPGASSIGAATKVSVEDALAQRLVRSVSASTNASNGVVDNTTERSGSHYSQPQYGVSPKPSMASVAPTAGHNHGAAMPYQRGQEHQNGPHGFSAPPIANQDQEKSSAYAALWELVRKTDASVVRQVVRENWQKCLTGSDYHSTFIINATITCSSPAVLSRTLFDTGNKVVKTSGREIAQHFGTEDLDQVADLLGPKLSAHFQDRVMAARLETIGAQDLINALSRAERLGYHVNDIVQKQPGPGGETVIPSMSAIPPVPPHNSRVGAPPPAMAPYQFQGPPQQPQPYRGQMNSMSHLAAQGSTQTPKRSAPALPPWAKQCRMCKRPCSSEEALNYHLKKAKCNTSTPHPIPVDGNTCVHCGCRFESPGGLSYHSKCDVCGKHSEEKRAQMTAILQYAAWSQPASLHVATPPVANTVYTPVWKQRATGPSSTPSPSGNDPYAKLSATDRVKFDAEMKGVDEYYGNLMKEASAKLPAGQREEELAKLKNRYNTKQSNTRKKYGIRLRERRANTDVDRSWNTSAAKRARVDEGPAGPPQPVPNQSPFPSVKESPRMRVPLSTMGGLSASSATAELVDPTSSSTPVNGQSSVPATASHGINKAPHNTLRGTSGDPMQIDNNDSSNSTDSEDVDIPARI